jgi:hypothetical protein
MSIKSQGAGRLVLCWEEIFMADDKEKEGQQSGQSGQQGQHGGQPGQQGQHGQQQPSQQQPGQPKKGGQREYDNEQDDEKGDRQRRAS